MNGPAEFPPLPSDGVPHVVDGTLADEATCACTDCRVGRQVEVERAKLRAERVLADAMPARTAIIPPRAGKTRAQRRRN